MPCDDKPRLPSVCHGKQNTREKQSALNIQRDTHERDPEGVRRQSGPKAGTWAPLTELLEVPSSRNHLLEHPKGHKGNPGQDDWGYRLQIPPLPAFLPSCPAHSLHHQLAVPYQGLQPGKITKCSPENKEVGNTNKLLRFAQRPK